jgi:thiol:disulfide interchange protein/DsbC/DsbD-like thiol-disulfide interchange protein
LYKLAILLSNAMARCAPFYGCSDILMRRPLIIAAIVGTTTVFGGAPAGHAQSPGNHVSASLISETRNVVPGQPLVLALRQQIEAGWHTYWVNPGESGLPTTIQWSLPNGFAAGPIAWPTPKRFLVGPVVDYGYTDDLLLPVTVSVPAGLQVDVTISAHATWLVCSDICIPEETDLSIVLPVGAVPEPNRAATDAFASARAHTPGVNPFPSAVTVSRDALLLHLSTGDASRLKDVSFFPIDGNVIEDGAPEEVSAGSDGLTIKLRRDNSRAAPAVLNGVLVFRDEAAQLGGTPAIRISTPIASATSEFGFATALLVALLGGLILNLMPCVLPVLFIKVLRLIDHVHLSKRQARLEALAYAAGVMASFAVVAGALFGLRAAGSEIGWGFQLQSPVFVALMVYVLFAVGLNLSGAFSVGETLAGAGSSLMANRGYAGSFFTGALTTLVATPCTAPFMAAAIGYAITQPFYVSLAVLEAIAVGLALPYVAIAFVPQARWILPKPGAWMVRLKEILAFPVYATIVWLVFVLSEQAGSPGVAAILTGLVLIGFAAWAYEAVRDGSVGRRRFGLGLSAFSAAGAMLLAAFVDVGDSSRASTAAARVDIPWQPFAQSRLDALRAAGKPVFIDVTAAWCITCKVNERAALADSAVVNAFAAKGITALRADWTRQDAAITRILESHGRAGVPLYLFYPAAADGTSGQPVVLPQILTAASVLQEIGGK